MEKTNRRKWPRELKRLLRTKAAGRDNSGLYNDICAVAVEHNNYLPPQAVQELGITHENLKLTAVFDDGEETYLAKETVASVNSRIENEGANILGVRLAYSESELVEMGLI